MLMKIMVKLSHNITSSCLLFALLVIIHLSFCDGSLIKREQTSRDDNTTLPEVTIPQGTVRGINMLTRQNRSVFGFIGIPYAQPPIGDLRFKAPQPPEAWNGTLNATSDTEPCPQHNDAGELSGNEDCLHLNVFTPQLPANENSTLLPVMVYIHGGAFRLVNNSIDRFVPHLLLDEDVLLVTPNFRVGVLGYLSTADEVSPGNYGLKDAVRVLEWIQDSIQYFGGDPSQVTLFGGSSGAMTVHLVALSNLTDGLFHKYITQSGSALSVTTNTPKEKCADQAVKLGEYLGCPTNTSTLLVNCLRDLNASLLVETNSLFYAWDTYPRNVWLPTTEPDIEGALLTDTPANLYAAGKVRDLPWMSSLTRDEGLVRSIAFYEDPDLFDDFLDNIDFALPYVMQYIDVIDDVTTYTNALKSYYLNDLTANRSLLLTNFTNLMGDGIFVYPAYVAFQQQLALAQNPLYFASFEYVGTFSHTYQYSGGSTEYSAAAHGDELIYLLGHQIGRFGPVDYRFNEADHAMVDTMVSLWTSFAINGTPSVPDSISNVTWGPYSSLNNYLRIGNGRNDTALAMEYDMFLERMKFWDELTYSTAAAESGGLRNHLQVSSIAFSLCLFSYMKL